MSHWLYLHMRAMGQALQRLAAQPLGSMLSILVIGIALALPACGYLLLDNVARLARGVSGAPEISIFLTMDAKQAVIDEVMERLRDDAVVKTVRFVSRDDALQELGRSGLDDVVRALPENPLPDAFVVTVKGDDPALFGELSERVKRWRGVEHVQLDSEWVDRLHALLELAKTAVLALACLLGFALVVITFNTIRLQILTQRHEIEVSRLLGATDPFIRRPFYWFACLQGVLGGVAALAAVWIVIGVLQSPTETLAAAYGAIFTLRGPNGMEALALVGFAAFLGWLGSALSVRRHLTERLR